MASWARPMSTVGMDTLVLEIFQSGAAGVVAPVSEGLHRNGKVPAQFLEAGSRKAVGGVALLGIVLDDDAAVDDRAVHGVRIFRMVGVDAVGIVGRNHEASCSHGHGFIVGEAKGIGQPLEHGGKEGGTGALGGAAPYFFVIKEGVYRYMFFFLPRMNPRKAAKAHCRSSSFGEEMNSFSSPQMVPGTRL